MTDISQLPAAVSGLPAWVYALGGAGCGGAVGLVVPSIKTGAVRLYGVAKARLTSTRASVRTRLTALEAIPSRVSAAEAVLLNHNDVLARVAAATGQAPPAPLPAKVV
jgi:hypothetical protein